MARLLVRYRDAGAIFDGANWRESAPPTKNEVASVLPSASDAKTTSDIGVTSLDQADVRRGTRVEVFAEQLLSPVTTDAQILRKA